VQVETLLSQTLGLSVAAIKNTITLIDEGATTPFIARYRKERTFGMDEVQIDRVRAKYQWFNEIQKRKTSILTTIEEQGKLTQELRKNIENCWDALALEDLYLPFKPKRRTKATIAKEKGLEPLALWLMNEQAMSCENEARRYITSDVPTIADALQGARDIVADIMNEDPQARTIIRQQFEKYAVLSSRVVKAKKEEGIKYRDYFEFTEPLHRCASHRVHALFRGEEEGVLRLSIAPDTEKAVSHLIHYFVRKKTPSSYELIKAAEDAYDRLLAPSIENETRQWIKSKADEEAIRVFANNAQQLLLSAPLGSKRILAIDPGFRTGCKVVCLNEAGDLLADAVIYPHDPQNQKETSGQQIQQLIQRFAIEAIAIGNGTAGRETEQLIEQLQLPPEIAVFMVNENGASIYSASEVAREEFPDKDITVRGAVSIGRRLSDPLAELVKIDPKSIGVGQYQHDVDQQKLKESLETVVQRCVNQVGVNLNTASKSLLTHVSGLNATVAQNIVSFRALHGAFETRQQLKKVPRLGDRTFEQCAAFLRIPEGKNPLDNSAVHPESYAIVERMAKDMQCQIKDLLKDESLRKKIAPEKYVTTVAGLPTIQDILQELTKPGRDPRPQLKAFSFASVRTVMELSEGMVIPGIITNITKFGCFVDIGVKQDGMVHISQMSDRFVQDPHALVHLQQHVVVKVLEVDHARKRISLQLVQSPAN
jgi:protein Tex